MTYSREEACRAWIAYASLNPDALEKLLDEYGSYEDIYDDFVDTQGANMLHYANNQQMEILLRQSKREAMHEMLLTLQRHEINIIAKEDSVYPELLRHISDAPPLLFYQGNPNALQKMRYVTMVGSRKASFSGMDSTRRIAKDLSRNGVCIVSGLAVGIDAAAHEGCLAGGSPTIGVAACGLDVDYPAENASLKRRILENGGILLSEAPPGALALAWKFPIRNRILAGLSHATLMMEAHIKSGTMSTVHHALDQGREVYVFPNDPHSPSGRAAQALLDDGAVCCTCAQDLLEDMKWIRRPSRKAVAEAMQEPAIPLPTLTEAQAKIYDLLQTGEQSFDQLAAATGYDAQELSGALTMLQIFGLIRSLPGKLYKKS